MRILLLRTGGFTAIPFKVDLDTNQLEPAEKAGLEDLIAAAQFFALPEKIAPAAAGADRFSYRLTVEQADVKHTVEASESAMPETLQVLVQRISTLGRASHR
jgi:hypothetical protein